MLPHAEHTVVSRSALNSDQTHAQETVLVDIHLVTGDRHEISIVDAKHVFINNIHPLMVLVPTDLRVCMQCEMQFLSHDRACCA